MIDICIGSLRYEVKVVAKVLCKVIAYLNVDLLFIRHGVRGGLSGLIILMLIEAI